MPSNRSIKLLLVSRESIFLDFISKRLQKYGYLTQEAVNGEEALEFAINKHFDLAVIDCEIPGMDGAELFNKLNDLQPCLQGILLCDQRINSDEILTRCDVPPFEYMNKPCDFDNLLQNITAAYEKRTEIYDSCAGENFEPPLKTPGIKGFLQRLRKWYSLPQES